jgi:hypothetical protein
MSITNVYLSMDHSKILRGLSLREKYTDREKLVKLVPTFGDREGHVVSLTDPHGRILDFLYCSLYFSLK